MQTILNDDYFVVFAPPHEKYKKKTNKSLDIIKMKKKIFNPLNVLIHRYTQYKEIS